MRWFSLLFFVGVGCDSTETFTCGADSDCELGAEFCVLIGDEPAGECVALPECALETGKCGDDSCVASEAMSQTELLCSATQNLVCSDDQVGVEVECLGIRD